MRVVITGATGFVGPYVVAALKEHWGNGVELLLTAKVAEHHSQLGAVQELDVTRADHIEGVLTEFRPDAVIHLAAIASPVLAERDPSLVWRVNLEGTLALGRVILRCSPGCWLLNIGSGLIYGGSARTDSALSEAALPEPLDEYSASKAAADLGLAVLARRGLKCLRFRPFNHTGPGQTEDFVVPAFAMQVARIEAGLMPPVISVGNLEAARDFLDVRDVADAYCAATAQLDRLGSGTILNIASGSAIPIADILSQLISRAKIPVSTRIDPAKMRPSDIKSFVGDSTRARDLLGWRPKRDIRETIAEVLDHARREVASRGAAD